jgi:signal transduction histidine kinase
VDRVSRLMEELLEYGRPHEHHLKSQPLAPVLLQAVSSCRRDAKRLGVEIRADLPEGLPNVAAEPRRLAQLFQNVVQNAVEHSQQGSVVRVAAGERPEAEPRRVECAVRDSGPGFAEENLSKVFEPFFTTRQGGTGLGLAIAWTIAKEHKGTITACNAPDGGAIVTVTLPVSEGA